MVVATEGGGGREKETTERLGGGTAIGTGEVAE